MFSNLSKGSVLYGLDTKGDMKYFTAPIESISMPRAKNYNTTFGQLPEFVVDIVAIVNGERKEFRQVPSNTTIADFSPADTIVIADNKDSLVNHIRSIRQSDQTAVNDYPMHKERIPKLDKILSELEPGTVNETVVNELKGQVEEMKGQIGELLSLLKQKTTNPV
jgi:hypothetical protein